MYRISCKPLLAYRKVKVFCVLIRWSTLRKILEDIYEEFMLK